MASMSLDKQIINYLPQLDINEKESLLSVIKSFLKIKDSSNPNGSINVKEYNRELDEALARMDSGEFHTMEEAEKIAESWF